MDGKLGSFLKLLKKVDGLKILKQYFKSRVLFFAIFQILSQGLSKKSLEIVRNSVDNKILAKLRKKYLPYIVESKDRILRESAERQSSNKVWILWLQGMNNAPEIVKLCYNSVVRNLPDKEVVLLTEDTYRNYVIFPNHVQQKIDKGVISKTHLSDLLRLELLTLHGGIWIDATVFISSNKIPDYMLFSELFLFQKLKPGLDGNPKRISSWYICAKSNHPILVLTKELLYQYWSEHNYMMDYFLMHDFMELSIETYPQEWNKVIPFSSSPSHILLLRLFETFDKRMLEYVYQQVSIHKLTYKYDTDICYTETYLNKILSEGEIDA